MRSKKLVQIRRLRHDTAGVLRALAELGDLGEQLGDDLILLEAEVSSLEAFGPVDWAGAIQRLRGACV